MIDFNDLEKDYKAKFTAHRVNKLLEKKLSGILSSTDNVYEEFKWEKQILHVWATSDAVRAAFEHQYNKLSDALKANTLVIVTVAEKCSWLF
jgi:hypothetical protein